MGGCNQGHRDAMGWEGVKGQGCKMVMVVMGTGRVMKYRGVQQGGMVPCGEEGP